LERDVLLGIPPVTGELGNTNRLHEALETKGATIDLSDSCDAAGEMHNFLTGQDLTGACE
jgi:hypothetical protein